LRYSLACIVEHCENGRWDKQLRLKRKMRSPSSI
jgi:hypothetical protein